MARRMKEDQLPDDLRQMLDEFREADDELTGMVEEAKKENPAFFSHLEAIQVRRNTKMAEIKTALKQFFLPHAEDDPQLGESRFGEFLVQPRRSRGWVVERFLEAADELGVFEALSQTDPPVIIALPDYHFNADIARDLGIYQDLVDRNVVQVTLNFQIDGKAAEDNCDGQVFEQLREKAWEEKVSSLAVSTPEESKPL